MAEKVNSPLNSTSTPMNIANSPCSPCFCGMDAPEQKTDLALVPPAAQETTPAVKEVEEVSPQISQMSDQDLLSQILRGLPRLK